MDNSFLESYLAGFERIEGWFSPDAALMFMAYNELVASQGVAGHVLEIGVHHGLSAIAVAAMRGEGARFVAVDLFEELQPQNVSASGHGSRTVFERNMSAFFADIAFVRPIAAASGTLNPAEIGQGYSFCHVDGGHSADETYADLELCSRVLLPGGLLALDDYFNPAFPGVCEGAIKFWLDQQKAGAAGDHVAALVPIAQGFNKVLFQKGRAPSDLNWMFDERFPLIPHKTITLWDTPVHAFSSFAPFIDVAHSAPKRIVAKPAVRMEATLVPEAHDITATSGATIHVPVRVVNRSGVSFGVGPEAPFGLSYHLTSSGRHVRFDNIRSYFREPIEPDEERIVDLAVEVPNARGNYTVEVDIIWEGIAWLKDRGLDTPHIELRVI